eukprot:m.44767 g.44767  ORF g.44767 m.44767 type:complete len:411 (+) comp15046_c0_seq4:374-1606(+)
MSGNGGDDDSVVDEAEVALDIVAGGTADGEGGAPAPETWTRVAVEDIPELKLQPKYGTYQSPSVKKRSLGGNPDNVVPTQCYILGSKKVKIVVWQATSPYEIRIDEDGIEIIHTIEEGVCIVLGNQVAYAAGYTSVNQKIPYFAEFAVGMGGFFYLNQFLDAKTKALFDKLPLKLQGLIYEDFGGSVPLPSKGRQPTIKYFEGDAELKAEIKGFFKTKFGRSVPDVDDDEVFAADVLFLNAAEKIKTQDELFAFEKLFDNVESSGSTCWRKLDVKRGQPMAGPYVKVASYYKFDECPGHPWKDSTLKNKCAHEWDRIRHHTRECELKYYHDRHNACCRPSHLIPGCRSCNGKDKAMRDQIRKGWISGQEQPDMDDIMFETAVAVTDDGDDDGADLILKKDDAGNDDAVVV